MKRAKHEHLARLYQITGWEEDDSGMDFLDRLARSRGKLLKGGEPDFDGVARTVLRDWQYGKIPYLTQPDENYESKEKKPLKEKPESETDAKKRQETAEKRKEIESKLNVEQGNFKILSLVAKIFDRFGRGRSRSKSKNHTQGARCDISIGSVFDLETRLIELSIILF